MKLRLWLGVALAAAVAACGTTPPIPLQAPVGVVVPAAPVEGMPADGQIYIDGNPYRVLAVNELPIVGVSVDSQLSSNPKEQLIDGNLSTQWVNGGYRNATSWAAVELAAQASLGAIELKTGPSPAGTSYDVQVSADGAAWATVLAAQKNTTWAAELKVLPAGTTGKFVRIFWRNSAASPQAHFAIFELSVSGEAATATPPPNSPSPVPTPTPSPVTSATPTTPPSSPTPPPAGGPVQKLGVLNVTANSTYSGLSPQRATDGNLSTQWASGGYQEAESWLAVAFAQAFAFESVRLKTGALPAGVSYRVEVSADGTTWTAASGNLTNTTWNLETKAVSGQGKYLRIRFFNRASSPMARFSLYELEVYGRSAAINRAPVIEEVTQTPYYIHADEGGFVMCRATDPDGDPLSYRWEIVPHDWGTSYGSVTGNGNQAFYRPQSSGPTTNDGRVKVTVSDGRGGVTEHTTYIKVYYGSTELLPANQATEWDPAKAASASFNGDVTVQAGGDFDGYNAVICEYSTGAGRAMALITPGTTVIPNVRGYMYMYLIGPTGTGKYESERWGDHPGMAIPEPAITLSLSSGGAILNRSITQANVVASNHAGHQLTTSRHGPWHYPGESDAKNGASPYPSLLTVATEVLYDSSRVEFDVMLNYAIVEQGDYIMVQEENQDDFRVMMTDSLGGLGDNTGAWTLYVSGKFMGPYQ